MVHFLGLFARTALSCSACLFRVFLCSLVSRFLRSVAAGLLERTHEPAVDVLASRRHVDLVRQPLFLTLLLLLNFHNSPFNWSLLFNLMACCAVSAKFSLTNPLTEQEIGKLHLLQSRCGRSVFFYARLKVCNFAGVIGVQGSAYPASTQ